MKPMSHYTNTTIKTTTMQLATHLKYTEKPITMDMATTFTIIVMAITNTQFIHWILQKLITTI